MHICNVVQNFDNIIFKVCQMHQAGKQVPKQEFLFFKVKSSLRSSLGDQ